MKLLLDKDGNIVGIYESMIEVDQLPECEIGYALKVIDGQVCKVKVSEQSQDQMQKDYEIAVKKNELANTDYKTLKYVDGVLTEEEYSEIKALRQTLRDQINELEKGE